MSDKKKKKLSKDVIIYDNDEKAALDAIIDEVNQELLIRISTKTYKAIRIVFKESERNKIIKIIKFLQAWVDWVDKKIKK